MNYQHSRRYFLSQISALSTIGFLSPQTIVGSSQPPVSVSHELQPAINLPDRENIVIRNAYVLTMDSQLGDMEQADIHIKDGEIIKVAPHIAVNNAKEIDARGMFVIPGLVETHWHIWTSLMRALSGSQPETTYFGLATMLGKNFTPHHTYQSTRLALTEALYSGITHVHDWSHNIRTPEYAQSSLKALQEAGIRGRFSWGTAAGQPESQSVDLEGLSSLHQQWDQYQAEGLLNLGLAWPGLGDEQYYSIRKQEIATARDLGLPISVHVGRLGKEKTSDRVYKIIEQGLLGRDFQLIHNINTSREEFEQIAQAGANVSISPYSEMRIGFGLPPVPTMLDTNVIMGLSVDTTPLSGNADMFAIMKITLNLANGLSRNEQKLTAKRVLEMATLEGARSMGLEKVTGSITPGKRADIAMIKIMEPNMGYITDPYYQIVESAQPDNVDTVIVDGRVLKAKGKLTHLDTTQILSEAKSAYQDLLKKGDWN